MKNALLISMVLLLSTCKKKDERPNYFWGEATATLNGQSWETPGWEVKIASGDKSSTGTPCNLQSIDIGIHKFNPQNYLREKIAVVKVPPQLGTYPVNASRICEGDSTVGGGYTTFAADGDVIKDIYKVLETEDNTITVSAYNPSSKEISGSFRIAFVFDPKQDSRKDDPLAPDTIRFTNGQFRSKVIPR